MTMSLNQLTQVNLEGLRGIPCAIIMLLPLVAAVAAVP